MKTAPPPSTSISSRGEVRLLADPGRILAGLGAVLALLGPFSLAVAGAGVVILVVGVLFSAPVAGRPFAEPSARPQPATPDAATPDVATSLPSGREPAASDVASTGAATSDAATPDVATSLPSGRQGLVILAEWWSVLAIAALATLIGFGLGFWLPALGGIVLTTGAVASLVAVFFGTPVQSE